MLKVQSDNTLRMKLRLSQKSIRNGINFVDESGKDQVQEWMECVCVCVCVCTGNFQKYKRETLVGTPSNR